MRPYLVIPGVLLALAGGIFALQGLGVVGPTTSFMYQSPSWVYQGLAVLAFGVVLVLVGIWRSRRGKEKD